MATQTNAKPAEPRFNVVSVKKTEPPNEAEGGTWYRYIIERGQSTIVGSRRGTLKQVTDHATEYAAELNNRAQNGGRSAWSPRSKGRPRKTAS